VDHTDDTGHFDNNISLSKSRPEAVIEELAKKGMDDSRLMDYGAGPLSPLSNNESEEGRSKNRRVELVLRIK